MKKIPFLFLIIFILLSDKQIVNCYIFSVIISIYNTGKYLQDTIGSLLNQTIGYKEIQIILVNDGSSDNSENICLKFQHLYFNNIIYIKIENSGVSKARNIGLDFAIGEYINFLDSDDLWDYKAFEYVLSFFKINKDINFVAGRLKNFEAINNYHYLDYKYYKTRIVNVTEEYNCIHESASISFFRASNIVGKKFEEGVKTGEDIRFVNEILLINPIMGLIREAIYLCRRRLDMNSRTQTQKNDIDFYFSSIKDVGEYLINKSLTLYNVILPFIQYYNAYDILFRIQSLSYKYLDQYNYIKYCQLIEYILHNTDDRFILEQKNFEYTYKIIALSKKYKNNIDIYFDNGNLNYTNYSFVNFQFKNDIIVWKKIFIENNTLHLEGIDNLWIPQLKYNYFCYIGDQIFFPKIEDYKSYDFNTLFGIYASGKRIIFDIPLKNIEKQIIYINMSLLNNSFEILTTQGYFSKLPSITDGYYVSGNYIIKMLDRRLILHKFNPFIAKHFEIQYCKQLKKIGKNYMIKLRKRYIKYKAKLYKKEIWIINDRKNKAGDNGEYFFRYLRNKKPKGLYIYFAIKKDCTDYYRLKEIGNILDLNSNKYLNIFLKSTKLISSVSELWVDNPFGNDRMFIKDLFNYKFIFIKNGIIKDDLSKTLNQFDRNIDLFITSTTIEYNYILSSNFGYEKKNIILTGMPRFDNLEKYNNNILNKHIRDKIILIIPTWRKFIKRNKESLIFDYIHSDTFINTNFFQFYNSLINNIELINIMKLYNYTGIFCLHPNFAAQWIDFKENEVFEIKENCDYQELIIKASLLITDYSSVFFDFGYLKKPIIYTQFDYKEYRSDHYSEGYFNYQKDGFGPVYNNINNSVNSIINSIKSDLQEQADYFSPNSVRFIARNVNKPRIRSKKILDSTTLIAVRNFAAGMMTGATSPTRRWFKTGIMNKDFEDLICKFKEINESQKANI